MTTVSTVLPRTETDYIRKYNDKIQSGEIVACKKIKRLYERLEREMNDPDSPFEYRHNRAMHNIEFTERYCHHSKGRWAGEPLKLELWQKAWRSAAYGFVWKESGLRRFNKVVLIVARKNGKSTDSASNGVYLLSADGEGGAEIYSAATKRDQAKIIWLEGKRMINRSPALKKRFKTLVGEIAGRDGTNYEGCVWRPLGADSERLDGLNVHGALMDEIHAWQGRELYDVIVDGEASRDQPLNIITTTAGFVREGLYDDEYAYGEKWLEEVEGYNDPTCLYIIYELDDRSEWTDLEMWVKANPGIGTIKDVQKLKTKVDLALTNPKYLPNLLTKDFNIPSNAFDSWLTLEDIRNDLRFELEELRDCYAIGGVDLSAVGDLTCATLLVFKRETGLYYVVQQYFIPQGVAEEKVREDKVPYDIWHDKEWVTYCTGSKVSYSDVTAWFVKMRDEHNIYPLYIGFDNWMASYWLNEMDENRFSKPKTRGDEDSCLQAVIQGAKTMSQPMKELAAEFRDKKVLYNGNPVLQWCLTNTIVDTDANENIRPVKGKSAKKRIDGAVSLIDAFVVYMRKQEDYLNLS